MFHVLCRFLAKKRISSHVFSPRRNRTPRLGIEALESRDLLSVFTPTYELLHGGGLAKPFGTTGPSGYTPSQILHAYGFDKITLPGGAAADGSGTTIAIVDAFHDPNIATDLKGFDAQFKLPDPS